MKEKHLVMKSYVISYLVNKGLGPTKKIFYFTLIEQTAHADKHVTF